MKVLKKVLMYSLLILLLLQLYGFYVSYKATIIINKPYKIEYFHMHNAHSPKSSRRIQKKIMANNFIFINLADVFYIFEGAYYNLFTELEGPYISTRIRYYSEELNSKTSSFYLWSISEGKFVKWA